MKNAPDYRMLCALGVRDQSILPLACTPIIFVLI